MDWTNTPLQKILLILFVLGLSLGIGWYGEKAFQKFFANSNFNQSL